MIVTLENFVFVCDKVEPPMLNDSAVIFCMFGSGTSPECPQMNQKRLRPTVVFFDRKQTRPNNMLYVLISSLGLNWGSQGHPTNVISSCPDPLPSFVRHRSHTTFEPSLQWYPNGPQIVPNYRKWSPDGAQIVKW